MKVFHFLVFLVTTRQRRLWTVDRIQWALACIHSFSRSTQFRFRWVVGGRKQEMCQRIRRGGSNVLKLHLWHQVTDTHTERTEGTKRDFFNYFLRGFGKNDTIDIRGPRLANSTILWPSCGDDRFRCVGFRHNCGQGNGVYRG